MSNYFQPVAGPPVHLPHRTQPDASLDGVVHCQVLAIEPERLLRISWRAGRLDTTVTWTMAPEGRDTRLFLEHDGFDPDDPIHQSAPPDTRCRMALERHVRVARRQQRKSHRT